MGTALSGSSEITPLRQLPFVDTRKAASAGPTRPHYFFDSWDLGLEAAEVKSESHTGSKREVHSDTLHPLPLYSPFPSRGEINKSNCFGTN